MQVIIKETGNRETLTLIDHKSGCDWVQDLIGDHDALGRQFVFNAEQDAWEVSQADYDWWARVIFRMQKLDDRIERISQMDTDKNVYDVILFAGDPDLEYHAASVNAELDDAFGGGFGEE